MALFTDGPPSNIDDLSAQDTQLLTTASIEGIDLTQKLSLAWDDVGLDLYEMLNMFGAVDLGFWQAPRPDLGIVVVTPPLRLWHTYRTLEMIYADAYNCQLNDRYAGKRDYFHERARWAHERLMDIGVGIAGSPVPRAARPAISAVLPGGAALPDGTYYAATAWVNLNGEEGAASDVADVATAANTVSVEAGPAPRNACGWNVYLGTDPSAMTVQNSQPLTAGKVWVQPAFLETSGRMPGNGQAPSYLKVVVRGIQRG
jgi:hypothetical protein